MIRTLRVLLVTGTVSLTLFTGVSAAQRAKIGSQSGAACGAGTSSAINEYCEMIPSATGLATPTPNTPGQSTVGPGVETGGTTASPTAIRTNDPRSEIRAYEELPAATRRRARELLSLSGAATPVPVSASLAEHPDAWSLPIGIVLGIVAIAAAGGTAAIIRRRGRTQ